MWLVSRTQAGVYLTPEPVLWKDIGPYHVSLGGAQPPNFPSIPALVLCFRLSSDLENHSLPHLRVMGENGLGFGSFNKAPSMHEGRGPGRTPHSTPGRWGWVGPSKRPSRGQPVRKGASPPTEGRGHLPRSMSAGCAEKQGDGRKGRPVPPLTG